MPGPEKALWEVAELNTIIWLQWDYHTGMGSK